LQIKWDYKKKKHILSRCLATIEAILGGFYEVATEMGSGATICVPSFIKIGSVIQLICGEFRDIQTDGDCISYFYFLKEGK
jgi:hypothetical protein